VNVDNSSPPMETAPDIQCVNIPEAAKKHVNWTASLPLNIFERIRSMSLESVGQCTYQAELYMQNNKDHRSQSWLRLSCTAFLTLQCQRCLDPVILDCSFTSNFRFVANEDQAAKEDELSDEDILVSSHKFNILELIEDELVLAIPYVPNHNVCTKIIKLTAQDAGFDESMEEKKHPFDILKQLKNK
jgi:uncharacterized protein